MINLLKPVAVFTNTGSRRNINVGCWEGWPVGETKLYSEEQVNEIIHATRMQERKARTPLGVMMKHGVQVDFTKTAAGAYQMGEIPKTSYPELPPPEVSVNTSQGHKDLFTREQVYAIQTDAFFAGMAHARRHRNSDKPNASKPAQPDMREALLRFHEAMSRLTEMFRMGYTEGRVVVVVVEEALAEIKKHLP